MLLKRWILAIVALVVLVASTLYLGTIFAQTMAVLRQVGISLEEVVQ